MDAGTLENLRKEVFLRVGRNLADYQRIEHDLKFMLQHGFLRVTAKQAAAGAPLDQSSLAGYTLGMALNRFLGQVVNPQDAPPPIPAGPQVRFKFSVIEEPEFAGQLAAQLDQVRERRNELVHESFMRWDLQSAAGLDAAIVELDRHYEANLPVVEAVHELASQLQQMREEAERMLKDMGKDYLP